MSKKIIAIVLTLCLVLAMTPLTASAIEAPDTSWYYDNPDAEVFYIGTAEELLGFKAVSNYDFIGKTIKLTADIDMAGYDWKSMYETTSKSFRGTLDGDNHIIFNLTGEPLFSSLIGTVKNLFIANANINGGGILTGVLTYSGGSYGVIENCAVSGVVYGGTPGAFAGGLFNGSATNPTVMRNCISMATVNAKSGSGAGGLAYNVTSPYTTIENCASFGLEINSNSATYNGRIAALGAAKFINNVSYNGTTGNNLPAPSDDPNDKNGKSITIDEIYAGGYLNMLPANFPIPEHLAKPLYNNVSVAVDSAAVVGFGEASFVVNAYLPDDKVNLAEISITYDAANFDAEAIVNIDGSVKMASVNEGKILLVIGVANDNSIANDILTALASIQMTAKDGASAEYAYMQIDSVKLYAKGVAVETAVNPAAASALITYRQPGDANGDGVIDLADLSIALFFFGAAEGDENWDEARFCDVDGDGEINMMDITALVDIIYG